MRIRALLSRSMVVVAIAAAPTSAQPAPSPEPPGAEQPPPPPQPDPHGDATTPPACPEAANDPSVVCSTQRTQASDPTAELQTFLGRKNRVGLAGAVFALVGLTSHHEAAIGAGAEIGTVRNRFLFMGLAARGWTAADDRGGSMHLTAGGMWGRLSLYGDAGLGLAFPDGDKTRLELMFGLQGRIEVISSDGFALTLGLGPYVTSEDREAADGTKTGVVGFGGIALLGAHFYRRGVQ